MKKAEWKRWKEEGTKGGKGLGNRRIERSRGGGDQEVSEELEGKNITEQQQVEQKEGTKLGGRR